MKRLVTTISTVVIMLLSQASQYALAEAGPWLAPDCSLVLDGRCLNAGYFTGRDLTSVDGANNDPVWPADFGYADFYGDDRGWSLPQSTDAGQAPGVAATNFVNFVGSYLNQNNPACPIYQPNPPLDSDDACFNYRRERLGAAFMVLVMIGGPYTTPPDAIFDTPADPNGRTLVGLADAQAEFPTWSKLVMDASAAGEIDWNVPLSFPDGHPNSTQIDAAHDVTIWRYIAETMHAIVFHYAGGGEMVINRGCGNMVGFFSPLDDMNMVAGLGGAKVAATGAATTTLTQGATYTITPTIQNTGLAASDVVYLELKQPVGITFDGINAPDPPAGIASTESPGGCAAGYPAVPVAGSPPDACTGPHWSWQYNNVPARSAVYDQTATFTVSPAAVAGSTVCFQSDVTHKTIANEGSATDYAVSSSQCYEVVSPRSPSVVATNSDIHAGGGICNVVSPGIGNVIGNPNANSFGQYMVSATGTISDLGSNALSTSTALNLGKNGGYEQVCRPNLYGYAEENYDAAEAIGGTINLSTLPGGTYFVNGSATISGTVSHKTTIVVSGTATIASPGITLGGGVQNPTNVPSLGLIVNGDIRIDPAVTEADAYMFSNGDINTCYVTASPPVPPTCDNTLKVDGFLMGQNINLGRLGPLNTNGAQISEQIDMNPELYLNPPQFFTAAVDDELLQGQGEEQPLF